MDTLMNFVLESNKKALKRVKEESPKVRVREGEAVDEVRGVKGQKRQAKAKRKMKNRLEVIAVSAQTMITQTKKIHRPRITDLQDASASYYSHYFFLSIAMNDHFSYRIDVKTNVQNVFKCVEKSCYWSSFVIVLYCNF